MSKQYNEEASNAIGCLFTNIFTAYRNKRAHREINKHHKMQIREFMLINELYLLEHESIQNNEYFYQYPFFNFVFSKNLYRNKILLIIRFIHFNKFNLLFYELIYKNSSLSYAKSS